MDDDDKIRRNLVVTSSITILLAWLQVPLAAVANRLFGTSADNFAPAAWRVWFAAIAVLLYLSLRFRFSEEVEAGLRALTEARDHRYHLLYLRNLRDLERRAHLGTLPEGSLRDEIEGQIANALARPHVSGGTSSVRPRFKIGHIDKDVRAAKNQFPLTLIWDIPGQSHPNMTQSTLEYEIPSELQHRLERQALLFALAYSRGSIVLLWPSVLALASLSVLTWKLLGEFI
jgi:hypothetical protein